MWERARVLAREVCVCVCLLRRSLSLHLSLFLALSLLHSHTHSHKHTLQGAEQGVEGIPKELGQVKILKNQLAAKFSI